MRSFGVIGDPGRDSVDSVIVNPRDLARTYVPSNRLSSCSVDEGADCDFYDPWEPRNIDQHKATNHASAIRAVLEDMPFGWCHKENDIQRSLPDQSSDFNGYVRISDSLVQMNKAPNQPYDADGSSTYRNVGVLRTTTPLASSSDY